MITNEEIFYCAPSYREQTSSKLPLSKNTPFHPFPRTRPIMPKRVAIVCTSATHVGPMKSGCWLEEVSTPYYLFKEAGFEVDIVSIKGGPIPIDASSLKGDFFTASAKKFMHDGEAFDDFSHSMPIEAIEKNIGSYDVLYMAGGHACFSDFADSVLRNCIEKMYGEGKCVCANCHGPVCLAGCKKADGTPLVAGLSVTAFVGTETRGC